MSICYLPEDDDGVFLDGNDHTMRSNNDGTEVFAIGSSTSIAAGSSSKNKETGPLTIYHNECFFISNSN